MVIRSSMANRWAGPALLLLLLAWLASAPCAAQAPERTGLPLWEVTHQGSTVYLMGSIHLLRPEVYPLDDALYEAFDRAEVVAFELDMGELAAAAPLMMARGSFQDGRTLADVAPDEVVAEVRDRARQMGLPPALMDGMKPWMAAMTLSSMQLQVAGFDAESGIDLHFFMRAREQGKETMGLETVEEQIEVFDDLDDDAQVAFLRSTLEQLDETVDQLDRATEYWRQGDARALARMFRESMGDQEELLESLLYARNRAWIEPIEELIRTPGTAMVIVGMGHLVGRASVIELLEERGWDIRPVPPGASREVGAGQVPISNDTPWGASSRR